MKTHNASIYHCVTCGRVVHAEFVADPPRCCGQLMSKSFTETIREGQVAGEEASDQSKTAPPVTEGGKQPK